MVTAVVFSCEGWVFIVVYSCQYTVIPGHNCYHIYSFFSVNYCFRFTVKPSIKATLNASKSGRWEGLAAHRKLEEGGGGGVKKINNKK